MSNKSDLFTEEKVPEQDARELAKTIKSGFGMISCKEGSGIKEPYSDDEIYKIYESIPNELLENNVKCGVCEKDYYKESLNN